MQNIKAPQFYDDPQGAPAYRYKVYIGKANTDPFQASNRLTITNGPNGAVTSNPYIIGIDGYAKNINDQPIYPVIAEETYSMMILSPTGALLSHEAEVIEDSFSTVATSSSVVDVVVNNFNSATLSDLTGDNTVYIQAYLTGWESTSAGNVGDSYHYRTGSSGTASTGNPGKWFDSTGAEFKPMESQELNAEMFGAVVGEANFQAIQDMADASSDLGRGCFALAAGEYLLQNRTNAKALYSQIGNVAIDISEGFEITLGAETVIKNETLNSDQVIFFGENLNNVTIRGGVLDANSSADNNTRAFYFAGCQDVDIVTTLKNSPACIMGASNTASGKQIGGVIHGSPKSEGGLGYILSGKGGGFRQAVFDTFEFNGVNGIEIDNSDVDSTGLSLVDPIISIGIASGTLTGHIAKCVLGGITINTIDVTCVDVFDYTLGSGNFLYANYNNLDYSKVSGEVHKFTSSGGGVQGIIQTDNPERLTSEVFITGTAATHTIPPGTIRWKVILTAGGGGDGSNGGNSTYTYNGTTLTAGGGLQMTDADSGTPAGGSASGGDINLPGQAGGASNENVLSSHTGGNGGASFWGGGGLGSDTSGEGVTTTPGAGAGGDDTSNGAGAGGTVIHWFERDLSQATEPLYTVGSKGTSGGDGILTIEY